MRRILLISICIALGLSMGGCKRSKGPEAAKENSGGSGYGVAQKSSLTMSDLYFFSVNTTKEQVLTALGSPQKYTIAETGAVTYLLDTGATLKLTYNERDVVNKATLTDESGKEHDLFAYLVEQKVLESIGGVSQNQNTGAGEQTGEMEQEAAKPSDGSSAQTKPSEKEPLGEGGGYFSTERYSKDIAEKLLKKGAKRQKILSALGKPGSFSSVSFKAESYLVDVYYMEDGSTYYLDYGYGRETLRAVRAVKGGQISMIFGSWEQEKRPKDFFYQTRNMTLFTSLKKNAKPSEIYRQYGEPDWYEGTESRYRDAYQLIGGAVLYLDFGSGHHGLTAANVRKQDGTIVPYTLR